MKKMWRRSDIEESKDYVLVLLQASTGERSYEIWEAATAGERSKESELCFMTQVVPIDLVLRGDVLGISEQVKLKDGDSFYLDSNGVWFTQDEFEDLSAGKSEARWHRGLAPV
jgi:hypothetical protein